MNLRIIEWVNKEMNDWTNEKNYQSNHWINEEFNEWTKNK